MSIKLKKVESPLVEPLSPNSQKYGTISANTSNKLLPMDVQSFDETNESYTISFWSLLYLLLWKNMNYVSYPKLICKLCFPWILVIIIGSVSLTSDTYNINCINDSGDDCPDVYYQQSVSLDTNTGFMPFVGDGLGNKLCESVNSIYPQYPGYLGFIPHPSLSNNKSLYFELIDELNKNINLNDYNPGWNVTCANILKSLNFSQNSLIKFFNSTDQFNDYINNDNYASSDLENNRRDWIGLLVTINNMNEYDYTISINDTYQADTDKIIDKYEQDVSTLFNQGASSYLNNGFIVFQIWIENSIINLIEKNNNYTLDAMGNNSIMPYDYLWNYFIYPSTYYERNSFWINLKPQFPTLLMFLFLFAVVEVINNLVAEKVEGIREELKIMGATQTSYWLSWFIWNSIEMTIISIGISIFGHFVGVLFSKSNFIILFLWIWGFGLSQMAIFSLLSVFINNVKLGGFIGGFGFWLINFVFSYIMIAISYTAKTWLCLIPNAAFMLGVEYISTLEEKQIGYNWDNINIPTDDDEITMSFIIAMLFIDTIIYGAFTIYFDNIVPSKFGQQKKWHYICTDYCRKKKDNIHNIDNGIGDDKNLFLKPFYGKNFERTNCVNSNPYIAIRDIEKVFKSSNKMIYAVDGVSLDLNRGEVFCLLGHNGAGKTTLISILVGFINATKGNALIDGYELNKDMDTIRRWIGFCPQKDILWPTMNVRQHLWLYAKLKGVKKENLEHEIEQTIIDCGIRTYHGKSGQDSFDSFENKRSEKLSGGEKRKLCLAIALIGGSKIVFLDEPTSGMDPQNRRLIWDLIEREKRHRCIILTTHYMEEADTLGDKIAIMSHGKIQCYGSSLYLKNLYDVGYTFTISMNFNNNDHNDDKKKLIDQRVTGQIKDSKCISYSNNEIKYQLPFEESSKFSQLFQQLDDQKNKLNINNYGISMTTLEQVFLKIGEANIDKKEKGTECKQEKEELFEQPPTFQLEDKSEFSIFFLHIYAILFKMIQWQRRDWNTIFWRIFYPPFLTYLTIGIMYVSMPRAVIDLPTLNLNTGIYYDNSNDNIIGISNYSNLSIINNLNYSNYYNDIRWINAYNDKLSNNGKLEFGDIEPINDREFITQTFQSFLYENRNKWDNNAISYGSFFINPLLNINTNNIYLGINVSSYHSLPIMLNLFNNWILNTFYTNNITTATIKLSNKPMRKTDIQVANENKVTNQILGMTMVFMLMFGFLMIPGSAIYFIVNEKYVKTKHQQFVSGVSVYAYYIGTYCGDLLLSIPTLLLLFVIMLFIPGTDALRGDAYWPTLITAIFFILSSIPLVYCFSFLFNKPATAVALGSMAILMGLIPLMVEFIADIEFSSGLKVFLKCLFGSYCAGDALLNYQIKLNFDPSLFDNYYSWEASGRNWVIMFCQIFVYFGILFLIEYLQTIYQISLKLGFTINEPDDHENDDEMELEEQDEDVVNEQNRLQNDDNAEDVIVLKGLRKVYKNKPKNNIAVKNMWFGVGKSEIFGFLGTNGAGKTTTLSMLTGEIFPSLGNAFINGISIYNQRKLRKFIGYTPQHDALFDKLTGIEHLKFYGLLKGLKGDVLDEQISILINSLSLNEHKNKKSEEYSGGNKRKLSVAIAMIGNPPILFLDEPSTGMDPSSRKNMQQFILNTMSGRTVILTTHSMEECEALSNKIGIMVKSQLKCLGTTQHLKSKYGKGLQVTIIIKNNNHNDNDNAVYQINEYLNQYFNSEIIERHNLNINIRLTQKEEEEKYEDDDEEDNELNFSLSKIFKIMEEMKQSLPIQSYAVSQQKLEQIFLMMAKTNDKDDDDSLSIT